MNSDRVPRDDRADGSRPKEPWEEEWLSAYIDGELSGPELARVESRLRRDAEARRWVAEAKALSGLMQSLPREPLDFDLRDRVLERVNENRPSRVAKQAASLAPSLAGESYGGLRRWVRPALAVAAVLLLMLFLRPGRPPVAERQLADVTHERGSKETHEPKALASGSEDVDMAARDMAARDMAARSTERGNSNDERGAARRKTQDAQSAMGGAGREGMLAAQSVPSDKLEERLAVDASEPDARAPMSFGLGRSATADQSAMRANAPESSSSALSSRNPSIESRREEVEWVVPVVLHDPRRDRPWFHQLLTEHGMQSQEAGSSLRVEEKPSAGILGEKEILEENLGRQATRGRQRGGVAGKLFAGGDVDKVVVEARPEQLHGLLRACRTDPDHHVTVGRIFVAGTPPAKSPDWARPGMAHKNRPEKQREDGAQRLPFDGDATSFARMPVRVRFELRGAVAVPSEERARVSSPSQAE